MRHRKHTVRFGRQRSHYKATLNHLVIGLIKNKMITTTKVKAKEASRLAEKLVTIAKEKTIANQRRAYSVLRDRDLVKILFDEIAPLFKERKGGYTRVMLIGRRHGDNAQMAILEFVEKPKKEPVAKKEAKKKKEPVKPEAKVEPKVKTEKKEEIEKTKPRKEKPVQKKEETKKVIEAPSQPEKPKEETKPKKPGFFKKLFGRKEK